MLHKSRTKAMLAIAMVFRIVSSPEDKRAFLRGTRSVCGRFGSARPPKNFLCATGKTPDDH
jgi:hypothetical protein